ncbi:type IV pilus biogenesis protein PilM [Phytobacter diazotrophicus]|uniref:type IV pilus biogenesis protein PilM n=1 Tax=Phytobacter diazotrophicus TaxID=395631 RepID=UPI00290F6745|nr:type IV pilus biogenesis protein PilM [Phytobacter diazotrophicus]
MGFGYVIAAVAFFLMLMTNSMTSVELPATKTQQGALTSILASDMLRSASAVNDRRYSHSLQDGELDLKNFGLSPAPDTRIRAVIKDGRLWIWAPDQQGLLPALNHLSSGSALVLAVTGGHLLMSDGTDMNLALPATVAEGTVVYLN